MDQIIQQAHPPEDTGSEKALAVSVIIPAYNSAQTLALTLEPLADLPADWEVLVVDDHSTDQTAAIARQAGFTVVRSHGVRDCYAARNTGAERSRGRILVFLDSDITVSRDALAGMIARFEGSDAACFFAVYDRGEHLKGLVARFKNYWIRHSTLTAPRPPRWINTSLAVMRRRDFLAAGTFGEKFSVRRGGGDLFFGRRLSETCGPIVIDDQCELAHHKSFTLARLLQNDFGRARGWFRLALQQRGLAGVARKPTLANVRRRFSLGTVSAAVGVPLLLAGAIRPVLALAGAAALILHVGTHAPFLASAARDRIRGWPLFPLLMLIDQLACAAGLAFESVRLLLQPRRLKQTLPADLLEKRDETP